MHKHECIKVTKKSLKLQSENKKTCFTLDNPHYALPLREIKTYNRFRLYTRRLVTRHSYVFQKCTRHART